MTISCFSTHFPHFGQFMPDLLHRLLQRDKTFITVEIYDNRTDSWEVVHTDASWETRCVMQELTAGCNRSM